MPVTITLTEPLAEQLRAKAKTQDLQMEEFVFNILNNALTPADQHALTPEDVVANIKATPPNPKNIHPATGSLLDALRNAPDSPDFDLDSWERKWAGVEREMKAVTRANDSAEGRE